MLIIGFSDIEKDIYWYWRLANAIVSQTQGSSLDNWSQRILNEARGLSTGLIQPSVFRSSFNSLEPIEDIEYPEAPPAIYVQSATSTNPYVVEIVAFMGGLTLVIVAAAYAYRKCIVAHGERLILDEEANIRNVVANKLRDFAPKERVDIELFADIIRNKKFSISDLHERCEVSLGKDQARISINQ